MKISEINNDYLEASGKVSDLVRQFDFAGIGVIWIFTVGKDSGGIHFSKYLLLPLLCFVLSLALDLAQYIYKTIVLGFLNRHYFKKYQDNDKEVSFSGYFNWPTITFFTMKTAFAALGYLLLIIFISLKFIQGEIGGSD